MAYFETLNYTLANEDTRIEMELLKTGARNVFSISGSGARVMPLIARDPETVDVVDMAEPQLFLCELRHAAVKALSYEEYLYFMGYRGAVTGGKDEGDSRPTLFEKLELSPKCLEFWKNRESQWAPRGFILLGRWENHFQKLGKIFRLALRMNVRPVFDTHSLEEQNEAYKKHFNRVVFRSFLRLVANEWVFDRFLYKGHFSGTSERRTETRPPWKLVDDEFHRMFTTTLVRKNYFLQILFFGRIEFEEGLPVEAHRSTFEAVKSSRAKVRYHLGDLIHLVKSKPYDFISLSDTISYLPADAANGLLQSLHPETPTGATVVIRSFLRAPTAPDHKGWSSEDDINRWAYRTDGTGVYQFHIYKKR